MRRLEFNRRVRSVPFRSEDSTEAAISLAQIVRERQRLQQERHTLLTRIGRIDFRLGEIGATETRIVPMLQPKTQPGGQADKPKPESVILQTRGVAKRFMEFTVQY
jgi:hypothetical protein